MRCHCFCFAYDFHFSKLCKNFCCACGIIDTGCMVHAVALTLHAWCMQCNWHSMPNKIYEQLWKVKIICKTAMVCKKKLKTHAVSMTPHARCMRCHWHRMHSACGINDRIFAKTFVKTKIFVKIKKNIFASTLLKPPFLWHILVLYILFVAFVINKNRT
jgi:hypothetical protein